MHIYYLVGFIFLVSIVLVDAETSMGDVAGTQSNRVAIHSSAVKGDSGTKLLSTKSVRAEEDAEERVKPSVSALDKIKTMFTSSKVSPDKLTSWLEKEKSLEAVFKRLHLSHARTGLFFNPQFATWVKYADNLSANKTMKGVSAISTLTAWYGDDALYKMITGAEMVKKTKNLATKLQIEQMQYWVTRRKAPDDVFRV